MENNPLFLSKVEQQCEKIKNSEYFKCVETDNIRIVLLSIFHLKKVLSDHNLLLAVNMTKIDNEYLQDLCKILYENVCVKNTEQKFKDFVYQFDISSDYLNKNSILTPYDVLINDLNKHTLDNIWVQSIASLATTEYIFSLIFSQLNKFANKIKSKELISVSLNLDETTLTTTKLLSILNSQQMYTNEIETAINETVNAFLSTFEILCEIFFTD